MNYEDLEDGDVIVCLKTLPIGFTINKTYTINRIGKDFQYMYVMILMIVK